jgi:hypothetical protein
MDLQTSKLELVKLIVEIDNQKVIEKLIESLKSTKDDFWLELSDLEKKEIQLGIDQLDNGNRVSLEEFIRKVS